MGGSGSNGVYSSPQILPRTFQVRAVTSSLLSLRGAERRSNLGGDVMGLPRPDKSGLAMTKSEVLDESGDYKNLEGLHIK